MLATRSPLWTTISKLGCPMGGGGGGGGESYVLWVVCPMGLWGELYSVGCPMGVGGGLCSVGCWWSWVIIAHRHHLLSMCIF